MHKHTFLLIVLTILFGCTKTQAQTSQAEQLFDKFKAASRFDYRYPREKVYVHLDNSAYFEGDTIWYKAYVVRASSLSTTNLSRVLYVELLSDDGQQLVQQTLQLDSLGTANGAISLQLPIHSGYHEVRAYTREMVNWGTEACFSRVIPVFTGSNPQRKMEKTLSKDITQLSIPQPTDENAGSLGSPRPYHLKKNSDRMIDFFPEGGERVEGAAQRIAFKLTDGRGLPVYDTLQIYRQDGTLYATAQCEHDGMGDFILSADFGNGGYVTLQSDAISRKVRKRQNNLPECKGFYALFASEQTDGLAVQISKGSQAPEGNLLGVAIFNRENVCYFDTITVNAAPEELFIPRKGLRGGVNRLELFNTDGISLATRLFWVPFEKTDSTRFAHIDVKQNKYEYQPFSPAVVAIQATTAQGQPIQGSSLSVSVRDESGNILSNRDGGIEGYMLLASEVKGYIHRPDLYFECNDAAHRRMLDLLLLVQGWSANSFDVMCGTKEFVHKQPIEEKLILRGTIYKDNDKLTPLSNVNLNMHAYQFENGKPMPGTLEAHTHTDSVGRFAFESNVNYEGEYLAQFTMRAGDKDQKTWSRLTLDRWFSPLPRPFYAPELNLTLYNGADNQARQLHNANPRDSRTFEWKDTIQKTMYTTLHQAEVVTHVKRYHGFTGNRYTWGGGEQNGMRHTTKYYDIQKEYERLKDYGAGSKLEVLEVFRMLESDKFEYSRYSDVDQGVRLIDNIFDNAEKGKDDNTDKPSQFEQNLRDHTEHDFEYRGRKINTYIDNEPGIPDLFCSEVKSISVVRDNKGVDNITGKEVRTADTFYSIYIYTLPEEYRSRSRKGVEYRHIVGFTPKVKFYSPNYRKFDLPSDKDMRRTLLWAPNVTTDHEGKANLIFFTNSRETSTLDISVRGITKEGVLIDWN